MADRRQPREAAARARHGKVAWPQSKTRARPRGSGESTPAPATPDERAAAGRAARSTISRRAQAERERPAERDDPVALLDAIESDRVAAEMGR